MLYRLKERLLQYIVLGGYSFLVKQTRKRQHYYYYYYNVANHLIYCPLLS